MYVISHVDVPCRCVMWYVAVSCVVCHVACVVSHVSYHMSHISSCAQVGHAKDDKSSSTKAGFERTHCEVSDFMRR